MKTILDKSDWIEPLAYYICFTRQVLQWICNFIERKNAAMHFVRQYKMHKVQLPGWTLKEFAYSSVKDEMIKKYSWKHSRRAQKNAGAKKDISFWRFNLYNHGISMSDFFKTCTMVGLGVFNKCRYGILFHQLFSG